MRKIKLCAVASALLLLLLSASSAQAFEFKPYGYIKLDYSADQGDPEGNGNWVRWINPKLDKDADRAGSVAFHARQSRLGFDLIGSTVKDVSVMGRIETDFTNGGGEYTYLMKLRKAYAKLSTPRVELLAGQESDIISPLVPCTVNYLVAWWAGNIGFRRPQVRFTYKHALGDKSGLDFTVGIMRTITQTDPAQNHDVLTPTSAGRIGYRSPAFSIGVSGHHGKEREIGLTAKPEGEVFDSYSANLDLKLNLGESLSIMGEVWYGVNLDTYFGGVGQGVAPTWVDPEGNTTDAKPITAMGGWAQIGFRSGKRFKLHLGGSMDIPVEDDLPLDADPKKYARSQNLSAFFNLHYMLAKELWVALEVSYWRTDYKEPEGRDEVDADDIRSQLALIYGFK